MQSYIARRDIIAFVRIKFVKQNSLTNGKNGEKQNRKGGCDCDVRVNLNLAEWRNRVSLPISVSGWLIRCTLIVV